MSETVLTLNEIIERSSALDAFKAELLALAANQTPSNIIQFNPGAPKVKVLRTLMKLLETYPSLRIEQVRLAATSGCSDFTGQLGVNNGALTINFIWDCAWRATQQGYTDAFGFPDQIRAAREFNYQCFQTFEEVSNNSAPPQPAAHTH
jgi:hypothetical protein